MGSFYQYYSICTPSVPQYCPIPRILPLFGSILDTTQYVPPAFLLNVGILPNTTNTTITTYTLTRFFLQRDFFFSDFCQCIRHTCILHARRAAWDQARRLPRPTRMASESHWSRSISESIATTRTEMLRGEQTTFLYILAPPWDRLQRLPLFKMF